MGEAEGAILNVGETVGTGKGPEIDIALEALEGVTLTAKAASNAIAVIAATPRGGLAVIIEVATGRCLAHHEMPTVSGVAEARDGFLLTAENGNMSKVGGEPSSQIENRPQHLVAAWDNHVIALD